FECPRQTVGIGPRATPQLKRIPESACRNQPAAGSFPFEDGVRADSRAMNEPADGLRVGIKLRQSLKETAGAIIDGGRDLGDPVFAARRVDHEEVSKRPSDIDADADGTHARLRIPQYPLDPR